MIPLYDFAIGEMQAAFARLESQVPPPTLVNDGGWPRFRYREQTVYQAIILKLAAVISRLLASSALLHVGHVNEQAVMHRLLDELHDDVLFLVLALSKGDMTELHQKFLKAFFAEEFEDPEDIVASRKDRDLVPRRKIRAYIAQNTNTTGDPYRQVAVGETLAKMYSGYVHAAAVFVLDLYGGDPGRFHTSGMLGTPRMREHVQDSWNYHYRSLLTFRGAAAAFGDQELHERFKIVIDRFERESGTNFSRRVDSET